MGHLVFVRHGQASFFGPEYDRLSSLGEHQAARLGSYWNAQDLDVDQIFMGPRVRHVGTAAGVQAHLENGGRPWPQPETLAELDEHQVFRLMRTRRSELSALAPEIEVLAQQLEAAEEPDARERAFQRLFEAVSRVWVAGPDFGVESWKDFKDRVNQAIDQIIGRATPGQRLVVFTSVGPISVAVQRALQCSDAVALETGWRLWNSSLTEFVFSGPRFTLSHFNSVPHLDRHEWTHR